MKSRITGLENSYHASQKKSKDLEKSLKQEKEEKSKFQEDYHRLKANKSVFDREAKRYKAEMQEMKALIEEAAKKITKLDGDKKKLKDKIKAYSTGLMIDDIPVKESQT